MLYNTIMVGENLKEIEASKYFNTLYDLDFDFLVNLDRNTSNIIFIDSTNYKKEELDDWLYAFSNIILINNSPIRAFIIKGYSKEENEFKGHYRIVGSYKSPRQLTEEIIKNLEKQLAEVSGDTEEIIEIKKMLILSMFYDGSIMILGETGTGKNHIADIIVNLSPRGTNNYYSINCAAIPENLLESELFGYKKGAFTGANTDKKGLVELANNGTLFLNEIGDMPLNLQAKILSITENEEFYKIGSTKPQKSNVRFLTATHKFTEEHLRRDLLFRLSAIRFEIPPLRKRKEDIKNIFDKILESKGYLLRFEGLPAKLKEAFIEYDYPGNIRELLNMIEEYLAMNIVIRKRKKESNENYINLIKEDTISSYLAGGIKYKEFLQRVYKNSLNAVLKERGEKLNYDLKKLSEEFGLTTRRIRDLLAELKDQSDS
jgi:transcriptional regulator with PAS, ATPase and Fis domain